MKKFEQQPLNVFKIFMTWAKIISYFVLSVPAVTDIITHLQQ